MWEDMADAIRDLLNATTTPFVCDTAQTHEQAAEAMNSQMQFAIEEIRAVFWADWYNPDTIQEQEKAAHQDTLACLNDLRSTMQDKADNNEWNCN